MKLALALASVIALCPWSPLLAQNNPTEFGLAAGGGARPGAVVVSDYMETLEARGYNLNSHSLLIQTLDGSVTFADHRSGVAMNPASVTKVATTFAALARFGPGHRFETAFYADGKVDPKTRTLKGNLILESDGDPVISAKDVTAFAKRLYASGVRRVTGKVIVVGPFTYGNYFTTSMAIRRLPSVLQRAGVRVSGRAQIGQAARGTAVVRRLSAPLREIVHRTNAFSTNPTADRLGTAVGGSDALEAFLRLQVGDTMGDSMYVERASGLGPNRFTAAGTVELLRRMSIWLEANDMTLSDVLPVAGIDEGTLHERFKEDESRGTIVAKTGTMPRMEGGISTLAGAMSTRDYGVVLFAIFNTKGRVASFRGLQDTFLKSLLQDLGGSGRKSGATTAATGSHPR